MTSPTRLLPQVRTGTERGAAPAMLDRWVVWMLAGAALVVVLAATTVLLLANGDEEPPPRPAPAVALPSTAGPEVSEPAVIEEPSEPPTTAPAARRVTRPGDIIVGLQATVANLVRDGQVSPGDGEDLIKRLQEARKALAEGKLDKVWNELKAFSEKIRDLRKGDKLSGTGYQALAAGLTQLVRVLPQP